VLKHLVVGTIVSSYGRQFIVETDNKTYQAVTKGKKTEYVVGDLVSIKIINNQQLQILDLLPRNSLIYRQDQNRCKLIASNVTQLLIVIAIKPNFNPNFLNSCLLFAESEGLKPHIIINKADLIESNNFIKEITELYNDRLAYNFTVLSALNNCDQILGLLNNEKSLLIGQSGVGKSTITNQIIPDANSRINTITRSENSGKHTTTNATLYHINNTSDIIDCPGLQEFGLYHLNLDTLTNLFPELRPFSNRCKFRNCRHLNEPGCRVIEAHKAQIINDVRFNLLRSLTIKLSVTKW
jgi:ribosome biogenesis GTPase